MCDHLLSTSATIYKYTNVETPLKNHFLANINFKRDTEVTIVIN